MDARKLATIEDLRAVPASQLAELISAELIGHTLSSLRHGHAQCRLGSTLERFARKDDAGVRYAPNTACRHDLDGWNREQLPTSPDDEYVSIAPN